MLQSDESDTAEMLKWLRNSAIRANKRDPGDVTVTVTRNISDGIEVSDSVTATTQDASVNWTWGTSRWGRDPW